MTVRILHETYSLFGDAYVCQIDRNSHRAMPSRMLYGSISRKNFALDVRYFTQELKGSYEHTQVVISRPPGISCFLSFWHNTNIC